MCYRNNYLGPHSWGNRTNITFLVDPPIINRNGYYNDYDGDGVPNWLDRDANGDGYLDYGVGGYNYGFATDLDYDGVPDYIEDDLHRIHHRGPFRRYGGVRRYGRHRCHRRYNRRRY